MFTDLYYYSIIIKIIIEDNYNNNVKKIILKPQAASRPKPSLLSETEPPQDDCSDCCYDYFPLPYLNYKKENECCVLWHGFDNCNGRLFWGQLSSLPSTRWAANACDFFMKPVYCINQVAFCFCCESYDLACLVCCNTCIVAPTLCALKTPFYALGAVASSVCWAAGKSYEYFGPEQQTMDDSINRAHENTGQLKTKIAKLIRENNLKKLIDFARQGDTQQKALASLHANYGLAVLCLAIAYTGDDVDFKWRKWFIKKLLQNGVSVDGYRSDIHSYLPLFLALKTNYYRSEEIVSLLCERGADIHENKIPYTDNQGKTVHTNYLGCAYLLYLKSTDPSIYRESYLVKAAILRSRIRYDMSYWLKDNAEILDLHTNISTIEELPSKIEEVSKVVPKLKIGSSKSNEGLYNIIGQYTGAFFPRKENQNKLKVKLDRSCTLPANIP